MKKLLLLISISVFVFSCTKQVPDLEITGLTSLSFLKTGGTKNISITAYSDWTAKCDAAWVTLSPAFGSAGIDGVASTIKVIVKENTEYDDRTSTISITSNGKVFTIPVSQKTQTAIILSEPSETIDYHAAKVEVAGQANVAITVKIPTSCTWVTYNPSKALSSFTYSLDVAENNTTSSREVAVSFVNEDTGDKDSFTIIQEGKPKVLFCTIPGLYDGDVLKYGYDDSIDKQLGIFKKSGKHEFQILNVNKRRLCVFSGIPSITADKLPEETFPVTVTQNTVQGYESTFTMDVKALEYEEGILWGEDKSTGLGIIVMLE